jgi:hypothetical protein
MKGAGLPARAYRRARRELSRFVARRRDRAAPTWEPALAPSPAQPRRFAFLDRAFCERLLKTFPAWPDLVRRQAQEAIDHRFDLLGSGPVTVAHGMQCEGLHGVSYPAAAGVHPDPRGNWLEGRVNDANLDGARTAWRLVDAGYRPIDWHLDFKSGYRWSEATWHGDIRFGHLPGVDVKVPWELARMQHLPTLAMAIHLADAGAAGFLPPEAYAREFRNQALDFIATNPPRFGVNWACTMDVAIRMANMLVAHDLVVASGAALDAEFERAFWRSMMAHARHVAHHLEWHPRWRGNHYLAGIIGLLFGATFLPRTGETDAWLAFSVQELLSEVARQFHDDGSHFEASVCYHRLSAEMATWAVALLADLPADARHALANFQPGKWSGMGELRAGPIALHRVPGREATSPVPAWCWERLAAMAEFTSSMTKPNGLVAQFGDNDSGRFVVLGSGEQLRADGPSAPGWSLDHRALGAGIDALRGRPPADPQAALLSALAGVEQRGGIDVARDALGTHPGSEAIWHEVGARLHDAKPGTRWSCAYPSGSPRLLRDLTCIAFPGMGCYVFRARDLYLAVRCGERGLAGLGAHAHCDQLAIELVIDGRELVRDPGSYLYTPFPHWRNAYRSAAAHHAPRTPGREPARLERGLFDLRDAAEGQCLYFGARGFIGRHKSYGIWVYRVIALEDTGVTVHDFADGPLALVDPTPDGPPFSPGYGRQSPAAPST